MKFSLNLLKHYFDFNKEYSPEELSEIITNLGFEVEEMVDLSAKYKNFVTAKIIEAKKHDESNKLNICKVDTGSQILNIVCGASNARAGIKVVLAKIGAIVPSSALEIKKGLIRGVESEGMICSAEELCLEEKSEGIIELPENVEIGLNFADYLGLNDTLFQIAITPNRGDGANIKGILRELQAKGLGFAKPIFQDFSNFESELNISIASEIKPLLMQACFAKAKIGEIRGGAGLSFYDKIWGSSNLKVVDISNFIMFLAGVPNHIYDAHKINGQVSISRSLEGEVLVPIKGEEINLPAGLLVMRDEDKILSLLGVMGDARSKVSADTTEVLIEVLHVKQDEVINSSRKTGIKSDSSYRFERGVDGEIQHKVLQTILSYLGVLKANIYHFKNEFKPLEIKISASDYKAKIGVEISLESMAQSLKSLEIQSQTLDENLICQIPSFRTDITLKEDLCEEIARIQGYENITKEPIASLKAVKNYDLSFEIKKVLQRSMQEVITYSFFKDEYFGLFSASSNKLTLSNPITSDLSTMRDSLLPNLLENVAKNERKSYFNVAIFEVGKVFLGVKEEQQQINFAGLFAGNKQEKNFLNPEIPFTIWDAKQKMLEVLAEVWGFAESSFNFKPFQSQNLHTTQSFEVLMGKNRVGIIAQIHPLFLDKFEIKQKVFVFEIYSQKLPNPKVKRQNFSEDMLPDILREIEIIVEKKVLFEEILSAIKRLRINQIKEISVKDVFEDESRIGAGLKSISLQFKIKQGEITMKKEEIDDAIIGSIVSSLKKEFNAQLRDGQTAK
jgi:phenylalanyl-tRNA synthetase beta chain